MIWALFALVYVAGFVAACGCAEPNRPWHHAVLFVGWWALIYFSLMGWAWGALRRWWAKP